MYPVDLHMHIVTSAHAYNTLSDYTAEVHRKGIKLFAITNHGPDMTDAPYHWHFISMRIQPHVVGSMRILRGIETDIKNIEGEVDCLDSVLTSLDLIIAGFHEPVFAPHDKDTNTQAMVATMVNGSVCVISYPGNPKHPVGIKAIAKAAAKYQIALETNNSSSSHSRKDSEDNCRAVAAAVRDAGGRAALGSDSHTAFTPGEFGERRKILDDVNFSEDRILNVTPKRLLAFLGSRGMESITEFAEL